MTSWSLTQPTHHVLCMLFSLSLLCVCQVSIHTYIPSSSSIVIIDSSREREKERERETERERERQKLLLDLSFGIPKRRHFWQRDVAYTILTFLRTFPRRFEETSRQPLCHSCFAERERERESRIINPQANLLLFVASFGKKASHCFKKNKSKRAFFWPEKQQNRQQQSRQQSTCSRKKDVYHHHGKEARRPCYFIVCNDDI
jgi:hypothetical protein